MENIDPISLLPFIDLTSLNTNDSYDTIRKLVQKANAGFKGLYPAAVCTYPKYTKELASINAPIKKCVVSTYFPSSQAPLQLKLNEIEYLNQTNIDEIDIVLSVGEFLNGNFKEVSKELIEIRKKTDKTLKLILETGLLESKNNIQLASQMGIDAGMDFLKTSTGKTTVGATLDAVTYMATTISQQNSKLTGLKIAGGIRSVSQAFEFIYQIEDYLGKDFINPTNFRIGASSLYDKIITNSHE